MRLFTRLLPLNRLSTDKLKAKQHSSQSFRRFTVQITTLYMSGSLKYRVILLQSCDILVSFAPYVYVCRNTLEALVWEKEAEVDRFRDRWPMSMLVSRSRLFGLEEKNKPRDVLAALNDVKGKGGVAILAEVCDSRCTVGGARSLC